MAREPIVNRVEVQIEGSSEDGGAVRLDALYNFLAELKRTLAAVERDVTESERASIAYKVVAVSYASPVKFVLEPIPTPRNIRRIGNSVVNRFQRDMKSITTGTAKLRPSVAPSDNRPQQGIPLATLEQFEKLASQRKQTGNISVGIENEPVPITGEFDAKLRRLLSNIYKSRGTFRGRLEAVNIHSSPCTLKVYPVAGPLIRCTYPKGRFPRIGEYLGHSVDVSGIVKYQADEPHPYEIEIEEIAALRNRQGASVASSLIGSMPDITGGQDIQTYLRELRHE